MGEKTPIRCKRCGTQTSWTPYCPSCGAYLEFAGDPPWVPEPPSSAASVPEGAEDDTSAVDSPDLASAEEPHHPEQTTRTPAEEVVVEEPAATAPTSVSSATPDRPTRRRHRWGGKEPWWRFWSSPEVDTTRTTAPAEATTRTPTPPPEPEPEPIVDAPAVPASVPSEEPAPQRPLQQRTIAVGRRDDSGVPGGVPCPQCQFSNDETSAYCARCGLPLIQTTKAAHSSPAPPEEASRAPQRRDWGWAVLVVILVIAALTILLTPPGQPFVKGIGSVTRNVTYWIVPDVGTPVMFASVKASSTGFGNPAKSLAGNDFQTFWTSAAENDFGAGTTLTFTFAEPTLVDRMVINPGIQNGRFGIRALATPRDLSLIFTELAPVDPSSSPTPPNSSSPASTSGPPPQEISASPTPSDVSDDTPVSASPDATAGSSASPSAPSPTSSPDPSSTTAVPTATPSPTPTPTATSTVAAELPLIVSTDQWTSIIQFDPVLVQEVNVVIDSVYPPALRDSYVTGTEGQVAITNVNFLPMFTIRSLFQNTLRLTGEASPSPSPSSTTGAVPSPAASSTP